MFAASCATVAGLVVCARPEASDAQAIAIADPPAIRVHPDHERVARNPSLVRRMNVDGEILFRTKFNRRDGAGRPSATGDSKPTPRSSLPQERFTRAAGPDASSCASCHNDPIPGGSGDFVTNVFVGAHFSDPPTLSFGREVTNERNTTSILGAGAIEMLAREMTADLRAQRAQGGTRARALQREERVVLVSKGVSFGTIIARTDGSYDQSALEGVDDDLVVKPFGVKGIAVSLREFSIAALNQHHGIEATERFDWHRTGVQDFDEDGVQDEFSIGQLSALVLFQASLPPLQRAASAGVPTTRVSRGEKLFHASGCDSCHVPFLELEARTFSEPNPYNRPGTLSPSDVNGVIRVGLPTNRGVGGVQWSPTTLKVWAYSDLKRHRICDATEPFFCNETRRQDNVPTDEFITPKLWDLARSAPYGHRGDCDTLSEAIMHHAGEATHSRVSYGLLPDSSKRDVIEFLLSLGAGTTPTPGNQGRVR